jgi:hypothetical protein
LEIPLRLNSKQAFLVSPAFLQTWVFHQAQEFNARKDSIVRLIFSKCKNFSIRLIFSKCKDFSIRLIFSKRKDFSIRLIFSKRKDFSICLIFSGCKYLYIISVFYFSAFLIKYAPIFDWRNYFWPLGLRLILQ